VNKICHCIIFIGPNNVLYTSKPSRGLYTVSQNLTQSEGGQTLLRNIELYTNLICQIAFQYFSSVLCCFNSLYYLNHLIILGTFFGEMKGRSVNYFFHMLGLSTIFLSVPYLASWRFSCLENIDDTDFYLLNIVLQFKVNKISEFS